MILADDLTGAGDVGAEFLRNGWRVRCAFFGCHLKGDVRGTPGSMVVMDMETRRLGRPAAVRRARDMALRLAGMRARIAYFKIDSTLRGNFLAEAEAVRRAARRQLVWIVPANPAMGRWTVGGRHFVNGRPIERTSFGKDWLQPIVSGDLLEAAARSLGGRRFLAHLPLARLRVGKIGPLRRRWIERGAKMVVADAVNERDLRLIAGGISRRDLACGAASLARFVVGRPKRARRLPRPPAGIRGLGVFGSLNPVTFEQLQRAARHPRVEVSWLGPRDIRKPRGLLPRLSRGWAVLALDPGRFGARPGRTKTPRRLAEETARGLARCAARSLETWRATSLIMSGGLTAAAVCEEIGIDQMDLVREVSPGLIMSLARSPERTFRLITKPGGFGTPDSLLEIMTGRGARA